MFSRRQLLRTSLQTAPLVSLATSTPCFLLNPVEAAGTSQTDRILVVIELNGGNDGINTVVPLKDEGYQKNRKALRIPTSRVIKLNDSVGLHPAMQPAADLVEDGRMTIVQGVGYPNPNRSHFRSMAIWHSARLEPDQAGHDGWLGRALDGGAGKTQRFSDSLCLGDVDPPLALRGRRSTFATIRRLKDVQLDKRSIRTPTAAADSSSDLLSFVQRRVVAAQMTSDRIAQLDQHSKNKARYPNTGLGNRMRTIAQLIRADLKARVYYTVQSGYDTHIEQFNNHYQLLSVFSSAVKAFLNDLHESKLADRVLLLAFSEFGRRVEENASQGTDHGTAGPVFLAGPGLKPGPFGVTPKLDDLVDGDLKMNIDFRDVYATVLDKWLSMPAQASLGAGRKTLPLFS